MEEVTKQLSKRFPLLARLQVQDSETLYPIRIPSYLLILHSVMRSVSNTPLCFVFPRHSDQAVRLATVLHGMAQFAQSFPKLATEYAQTEFKKDEKIRINPSHHVFKFGGLSDESPGKIWIHSLSLPAGRMHFPVAEILRLERTDRTLPKGRLTTKLRNLPPDPLDLLLDTKTYGNKGLFRNEVVLLDTVEGFSEFTRGIKVQTVDAMPGMPSLNALLPFGEIIQPGNSGSSRFKKWDDLNPVGEPCARYPFMSLFEEGNRVTRPW